MTVINTGDSERMRLAGEYLLVVTNEHLSLHHAPIDGGFTNRNRPAVTWHLDDIPRFRLQKLNHLNDAEKIFIINLARYALFLLLSWMYFRILNLSKDYSGTNDIKRKPR